MVTITITSHTYGTRDVYYDEEDHDLISKLKWRLAKGRNTYYAVAYKRIGHRKYTQVAMHRLIMGTDAGICVDHKDRNGLNNTRINLRQATIQENNRNATIQRNNTTGYRGVDYNKNHKAFRARVNINRKSVYCRYFRTAEEAALAYNEAAKKYFGEFANLNTVSCASA